MATVAAKMRRALSLGGWRISRAGCNEDGATKGQGERAVQRQRSTFSATRCDAARCLLRMRLLWLQELRFATIQEQPVWLATRSKTDTMSRGGHIETLIAEVSSRRILWDMRDKNYHNRYAVDEEWSQVAKAVDMSSNEAKAKWKSLRDSFRRELKKMPQREGDDILNLWYSKWAYFESMLFLRDVMKFKDEHKTLRCSDAEEYHMNDSDCKERHLNGEDNPQRRLDGDLDLSLKNHNHSDNPRKRSSGNSSYFLSKKKRKHDRMDVLQKILVELESRRRDHPHDEEDDDLNFFKSLLPYMRKLPPLKKLQIRSQYQSILISEIHEMEHKTQNSSEAFSNFTYPSSSSGSTSSSTTVSAVNSDVEDDELEIQGWMDETEEIENTTTKAETDIKLELEEDRGENNNPEV